MNMSKNIKTYKQFRGMSAYRHPANYFVKVFRDSKNSVVSIRVKKEDSSNLYAFPFHPPNSGSGRFKASVGTGFIIHPKGYILTCEHVIHHAEDISVSLYNGTHKQGKVIWSDSNKDVAIIKINGLTEFRPIPLGTSRNSKVGEIVMAIGNPMGLEHTITTGVISAKNRQFRTTNSKKIFEDVLQTDCAINPGNSGGPLINLRGQVIGMNSFMAEGNQGLGFAIGIDCVREAIQKVIKKLK
jgi:serine protease Do